MKQYKLSKGLNTLDVFSIASGAMISSGLFILPAVLYSDLGPSMIICYFLAGLLFLPAIFAKIELTTAMPKAGGSYFFIERSLGSLIGTVGGLTSWLSLCMKSAFSFIGIGAFVTLIFPNSGTTIKLIAVLFCTLFTILNLFNIRISSGIQNFLVLSLITILIIYIATGMPKVNLYYLLHSKQFTVQTLIAGIGLVFISYGGLTKVSSIAEEVKNPGKTIKRGMFSSFFIVWVLYTLCVFVVIGTLTQKEFDKTLVPLSISAFKIMGLPGEILLTIAGIMAVLTTGNAGLMTAARFPLAMSRDKLLPSFLSQISRKSRIPTFSVLLTGATILLNISILDIKNLVKIASAFKLLEFIFILLAVIVMRESRILNYKPSFKSPLYPWIQIAGIVAYMSLLALLGLKVLAGMGIFILTAITWHLIYKREFTFRKSALIYIIERITDKQFADKTLSTELTNILKERDEIIEDRFDKLVKKAAILDLKETIPLQQFFQLASQELGKRLKIAPEHIYNRLIEREKESTTEIRPGLAVPHITIEGQKKFDMLIARCEGGITFTEEMPPVYAVFLLIGTRDERTFHLKALSAIAQIIQNPDFDKHWLRARGEQELRELILIADRIRDSYYKPGKYK